MQFDKHALREQVLTELRAALALMERSAKDAWVGATHEENKPEGPKDMRSTEASYIARGQSLRYHEIAASLAAIENAALPTVAPNDACALGVLFIVEAANAGSPAQRYSYYWLLPAAGGTVVQQHDCTIKVITLEAPLGKAVLGLCVGDEFSLNGREYSIAAIC